MLHPRVEGNTALFDDVPGLTALVVYLRPSLRGQLLPVLADLGIFVAEAVGEARAANWTSGRVHSDLVIVVGDDEEAHLRFVSQLASRVSAALIAVTPNQACIDSYLRAGAQACVTDDDTSPSLAAAIRPVAQFARRLKDRALQDGRTESVRVFHDLDFMLAPPELSCDSRSVALSGTERDVLLALVESLGSPVSSEALEARLTRPGTTATRGYLKTVILRIRRKVEAVGGDSGILGAVRGYGYVLRG
jgi:DNA-binding response OmpR family regulator